MVSDGGDKSKDLSKITLSKDEKKSLAKEAVKKEVEFIKVERAEWTQEPTAFDHLPPAEKPFAIEPFPHERQRLPFRMTDEDRKRRKIWVESQELTEREPIRVPELERMIYNPIRRLYRLPTDRLFNSLAPMIGEHRVPFFRFLIPKIFLGYVGACFLYYQLKYNPLTWEERGKGIGFVKTRGFYLPEEEKPPIPKKWDYNDKGFQSRTAYKNQDYAY